MKITYSLIRFRLLACIILLISTTQAIADYDDSDHGHSGYDPHKWIHNRFDAIESRLNGVDAQIANINRRLDRLAGVPEQLTEAQNGIVGLRTANEQTRAETTKIKEETIAATNRLGEKVASANENVNRLEVEQQKYKQAFEDYKDQTLKEEEKIHERREARFYRSLKELFIKGDLEEDKGMDECFKKACEISPNFCASYGELKKFHDNWNKFMEESNRFEKLFWELLANNVELQNIIDRPVQPAISGGSSNDLLALGTKPVGEL